MIVCPHREPALAELDDADHAVLDRATVAIAEHGYQHAVVTDSPVDVEVVRVVARRSVLEHVEPPAIAYAGDRHVIRHDVKQDADACGMRRRREPRKPGFAAERVADPFRIDDRDIGNRSRFKRAAIF